MSSGRRLAKRSIIGTKVCAPGPDGLWYSGVIQDVKTPPTQATTGASGTSTQIVSSTTGIINEDHNGFNINDNTKYIVRFDFKTQTMDISGNNTKLVLMEARRAANMHISPAQTLRRNAMIKEFRESDLIGPGFRSIMGIQLLPDQRVFLTYNGRETSGDVISHDVEKDEVFVKITGIGNEEPIELKKRLEEVRLLESRRSARLADQDRDTDFARLADMGGDRRRTSHSIEVPFSLTPQQNSRKRPPSYTHDFSGDKYNEEDINACKAAMILMNLSNSPKSPKNGEKWLGSSPGSSSASWSSGSSSPPLSDDGHAMLHSSSNIMLHDAAAATARIRTTSVSTSDEGIVVDFKEEVSRKKRGNKLKFKCMWKGCNIIEATQSRIKGHIRHVHLGQSKKARHAIDHDGDSFSESESGEEESGEEDFYYEEEDDDEGKTPSPTSPPTYQAPTHQHAPPTLSHRDMARPPHEDPEYQRQVVGNFKQGRMANHYHNNNNGKSMYHHINGQTKQQQQQHQQLQIHQNNITVSCIPTSPLANYKNSWPSTSANTANDIILSPQSVNSTATGHLTQQQQQQHQQQHQSISQQQQQQQQQPQHSPASTIIKHARSSPRPSQSTAPYPSPSYGHHHHHQHHAQQQQQQQQHHNYSSGTSSNNSSCNNSPIINHNSNNNSANNVFQQLSQQNVTITAHNNSNQQQQQQQQQQQHLSAVTITPNYVTQQVQQSPPQQQQQQQQSHIRAAASTITANNNNNNNNNSIQQNQQQQQSPPQHVTVQHAVIAAAKHTPNSPNRRTRGENKKCRKVYGMERRDEWCTQCKWKKACTRFGD